MMLIIREKVSVFPSCRSFSIYEMIILSLGTFRRVLFLTALYLSLALILLIAVQEFAEDKGMPVVSWIFVGFTISVSASLPFSCYAEWPVTLYDFIPLLAGIAVLIPLIIGKIKAH